MNITEYNLEETTADENWDMFVDDSLNGTIFSKSYYLSALSIKYKLFYCYKKDELRAALLLLKLIVKMI